MYHIDSDDIWVKIKLTCMERTNYLKADLDIRVDKQLTMSDFDNLLQKLAVDIWNRCCPVI